MAYSFKRGISLSERISKNICDMMEFEQGTVCYDRDMGVSTAWRHKDKSKYTAQMLTEASDMLNSRETRVKTTLTMKDGAIFASITEDTDND